VEQLLADVKFLRDAVRKHEFRIKSLEDKIAQFDERPEEEMSGSEENENEEVV